MYVKNKSMNVTTQIRLNLEMIYNTWNLHLLLPLQDIKKFLNNNIFSFCQAQNIFVV